MSWSHSIKRKTPEVERASAPEILASFQTERELLLRLALLITGDSALAEESLVKARELAGRGPSPFRERLRDWAKWITVKAAIARTGDAISKCESAYKNSYCSHVEHLVQVSDEDSDQVCALLLRINPDNVIAELGPLARSVLILRKAVKASILDCTLRLNVSSQTVVAANCRAMTWLRDAQTRGAPDKVSTLPEQPSGQQASEVSGRESTLQPASTNRPGAIS
jgi:hypothetical protein